MTKQLMAMLAKAAQRSFGDWTKWHDLGDGNEARVCLEYDQHTHLMDKDWADSFGTFSSGLRREAGSVQMTWPTEDLDNNEVAKAVHLAISKQWELEDDAVDEEPTMALQGFEDVTIHRINKDEVVFEVPAQEICRERDSVWWVPPKDVTSKECHERIAKRVRGYFRDDWTFCGVCVEVRHKACEHCGERKVTGGSLWGIETDAGDHFAEVIGDLIAEAA